MPSRCLSPRTALDVQLSATIVRNLLAADPAPVLAELRALAADDVDLLAQVAGSCAAWYDSPTTHTLCAALLDQINGAEAWCDSRRSRGTHGTTGS